MLVILDSYRRNKSERRGNSSFVVEEPHPSHQHQCSVCLGPKYFSCWNSRCEELAKRPCELHVTEIGTPFDNVVCRHDPQCPQTIRSGG